jgi:hypothetical protein
MRCSGSVTGPYYDDHHFALARFVSLLTEYKPGWNVDPETGLPPGGIGGQMMMAGVPFDPSSFAAVGTPTVDTVAALGAVRVPTAAWTPTQTITPTTSPILDTPVPSVTPMPNNMPCVPMAYPNPIRGDKVLFDLGCAPTGVVECRIYSLDQRLLRRLVWNADQIKDRKVEWDTRDDAGQTLANGLYLAVLRFPAADRSVTKTLKVLILR